MKKMSFAKVNMSGIEDSDWINYSHNARKKTLRLHCEVYCPALETHLVTIGNILVLFYFNIQLFSAYWLPTHFYAMVMQLDTK